MIRRISGTVALAALLSSCAGGRAGPLGLGAIFGKRTLAAAEPLFSHEEVKCLNSANGLLSATFQSHGTDGSECGGVFTAIKALTTPSTKSASAIGYDKRARNEIIDGLIATSNYKCGEYTSLLKNADGAVNVSLSIGSILTGGLGAFVGGPGAAKALSGSAAILSGSRAAVNEVYLTNQTIHVLTAALEKARAKQRDRITDLEDCPEDKYTLMRGIEDAFAYHNSCSLVTGLAETVLAVERTDNPGLDAMRKSLADYALLIRQANDVASGAMPTPMTGNSAVGDVGALKALTEKITLAQTDLAKRTETRLQTEAAIATKTGSLAAIEDVAQKTALENTIKNLKNDLHAIVENETNAKWLVVGLEGELQRTLQLMASRVSPASIQSRPESRKCPYA